MGDLQVTLTYWGSFEKGQVASPSQLLVCAATGSSVVVDACGSVSYWDSQGRPVSVVRPRKRTSAICLCVHFGRPAVACFLDDGVVVVADVRDGAVFAESATLYASRTAQYAAEVPEGATGYRAPYIFVVDAHCAAVLIDSNTLTLCTRLELPPPGFVTGSCWYRSTLAVVMPDKTLRLWRVDEPPPAGGAALAASQPTLVTLPHRGTPSYVAHHPFLPLTLVVTVNAALVYYDLAPKDPVCTLHADDAAAPGPTVFQTGAFVLDPSAAWFAGEKARGGPANASFGDGGVQARQSFASQPPHPASATRGVSTSHLDLPGDTIPIPAAAEAGGVLADDDGEPPVCLFLVTTAGVGYGYRLAPGVARLAASKRRVEAAALPAFPARQTFAAPLFPALAAAPADEDAHVLVHLTPLPATKHPLDVRPSAPMATATPVSPRKASPCPSGGGSRGSAYDRREPEAPPEVVGVRITAVGRGQLMTTVVPLAALLQPKERPAAAPADAPPVPSLQDILEGRAEMPAPPPPPADSAPGPSLQDILEGRAEMPAPPPPAADAPPVPSLQDILEGRAEMPAPPPGAGGGGVSMMDVLEGRAEMPPPRPAGPSLLGVLEGTGPEVPAPGVPDGTAEAPPPAGDADDAHWLLPELCIDMHGAVQAKCVGIGAGGRYVDCGAPAAATVTVTASYLHRGEALPQKGDRLAGSVHEPTSPVIPGMPSPPPAAAAAAATPERKERGPSHTAQALQSVSSTLSGVGHAVWGGVKTVSRSPRKIQSHFAKDKAEERRAAKAAAAAAPRVPARAAAPTSPLLQGSTSSTLPSEKPYLFYGYSDGVVDVLEVGGGGRGRGRCGWRAFPGSPVRHITMAGGSLFTADALGSVRSFSWGDWAPLHTYTYHEGAILPPVKPPKELAVRHGVDLLCIGEEGNVSFYLASGEGWVCAGNVAAAGEAPRPGGACSVTAVHYLPEIECLAVCDGARQTICVWHVVTRALVRVVDGDGFSVLMASLFDTANLATSSRGPPMAGVTALTVDLAPLLKWVKLHPEVLSGEAAAPQPADEEGRRELLKSILSHLLEADTDAVEEVRGALGLDRLVPDGACALPVAGVGFSQRQGLVSMHAVTPGATGSASPGYHRHRDAQGVSSWEVFHLPSAAPYEASPLATARRVVAVLSLLHGLCNHGGPTAAAFKDAVHHYASTLPTALRDAPHAFEADFFWCLDSIKDPLRDIQFAARCGLNGVLRLRGAAELRELSSTMMQVKTRGGTAEQVQVSYLGISVMVAQCPELLRQDESVARYALSGLMQLCTSTPETANATLQGVALSHLADSYGLWAGMVKDPSGALKTLLAMSTTQDGYERLPQPVSKAAFRAFKACALHHLPAFFAFADQTLSEVQAPRDEDTLPSQNCVLYSIAQMIKTHAVLLIPYLLRVALVFLKALDPHFPRVRDKCVVTSAQALKTAVSTFPMMSFHQQKQSLVVGDTNGQCVVWDTTTGAKCFVWNAHEHNPVTCVAFSALGDQMATFSMRDGKVRIWSSEMSLFGLLSPSHKPTLKATLAVPTEKQLMSSAEVLQHVTISWTSPRTVELAYGPSARVHLEV